MAIYEDVRGIKRTGWVLGSAITAPHIGRETTKGTCADYHAATPRTPSMPVRFPKPARHHNAARKHPLATRCREAHSHASHSPSEINMSKQSAQGGVALGKRFAEQAWGQQLHLVHQELCHSCRRALTFE